MQNWRKEIYVSDAMDRNFYNTQGWESFLYSFLTMQFIIFLFSGKNSVKII